MHRLVPVLESSSLLARVVDEVFLLDFLCTLRCVTFGLCVLDLCSVGFWQRGSMYDTSWSIERGSPNEGHIKKHNPSTFGARAILYLRF